MSGMSGAAYQRDPVQMIQMLLFKLLSDRCHPLTLHFFVRLAKSSLSPSEAVDRIILRDVKDLNVSGLESQRTNGNDASSSPALMPDCDSNSNIKGHRLLVYHEWRS